MALVRFVSLVSEKAVLVRCVDVQIWAGMGSGWSRHVEALVLDYPRRLGSSMPWTQDVGGTKVLVICFSEQLRNLHLEYDKYSGKSPVSRPPCQEKLLG